MIIFNILQSDESLSHSISDYLIEKKYALQTHVDTNVILDTVSRKPTIRLFFITRSLLFSTIEKDVFSTFPSTEIVMYAEPVSHISEAYGNLLRENLVRAEAQVE
jgi:hypothetical protein